MCMAVNAKVIKTVRKINEVENNRKSLKKEMNLSNWERFKILLEKDHQLYMLWCKRTNYLSYLLKVRINN